ncbi:hypothetical protein OKA04_23465 [Luteolibacter flavescens]|uniref:Uncharacterized protein n=1 Tax=Luteolibacter flavescens TaxID=1859460 RepID=A0ABT3FVV2_9BACT|nr:hypothetical protein [Luteolibacter flavescens]MCW1887716.1 hypothetical protein [Luteolibacter flavescens]
MNDPVATPAASKTPDLPSGAVPRAPSGSIAKILCRDVLKAKGFTFAKGKVVEGVSLEHAKHLVETGKAEILDVA